MTRTVCMEVDDEVLLGMKQIVCNASPLITLAKAGLLNALPDQFQRKIEEKVDYNEDFPF